MTQELESVEELKVDPDYVEPRTWLGGKVCNESHTLNPGSSDLPSRLSFGDICRIVITEEANATGTDVTSEITGRIVGINFSASKIHYDVAVKIEGSKYHVVIHGLDSCDVH